MAMLRYIITPGPQLQLSFLWLAALSSIAHGRRQQSLLQTWTKSHKMDTISKVSAVQATTNQWDFGSLFSSTSDDSVQSAGSLKFYMPSSQKCEDYAWPEDKIVPGNGTLNALSDWLWLVKEEHYDNYVQHRFACNNLLVNSSEEADLCYPSCTPTQFLASKTSAQVDEHHGIDKSKWMPGVCFEVPPQKIGSWSNCQSLCIQPEANLGTNPSCTIEVPYLHGILWPAQKQDPDSSHGAGSPWTFNFERTTMLAFVGGEFRGFAHDPRNTALHAMEAEASRINAASPTSVFSAHLITDPDAPPPGTEIIGVNDWYAHGRKPEFYLDAWGVFASANFSWQPHGDTATRKSLYDSVMFGCVPVIDTRAASAYRRLFNGALWKDVSLEDVFVVIPEGKETDGVAILQTVNSIPADEVDKRRSRLQQIATALQWGEHTPNDGDALMMALKSFHSGP